MALPDDAQDLLRYAFVPTNSLDRLNAPALRIAPVGGVAVPSPAQALRTDNVPDGLEFGMVQTDASRANGAPALRLRVIGGGI